MKKLALSIAITALTAVSAIANPIISTGPYVGAAIGYGVTTARFGADNTAGSMDVGGTSANIGLLGGYGWLAACWYWGGELAYTLDNTKLSDSLNPATVGGFQTFKRYGYFNAALRGGYLFTPNTMMYLRLGTNVSRWTLNNNNLSFANARLSGSKTRFAFVPGVGLEAAVHMNVYARAEYTYDFGQSVRASDSVQSVEMRTVRSQAFKMAVLYKF